MSDWHPNKWRLVELRLGWDLSAEAGGGSHSITCTYAIPDDGRDLIDMTMEELRAYPAVTATALLDKVVKSHKSRAQ